MMNRKLSGNLEIFDVFKSVAGALSDNSIEIYKTTPKEFNKIKYDWYKNTNDERVLKFNNPIEFAKYTGVEKFNKKTGKPLSDSPIQYEALPGLDSGCWKINCDRSPFYIPFQTQSVNYNVAGVSITARKEINILPYIIGIVALYFIMK